MRAVLIAAALLAAPALAQNNKIKPEPQPAAQAESLRPPPGTPAPAPNPSGPFIPGPMVATPVVVDRDSLMQQLARINEKLAQATGQARRDKQLQKLLEDARASLKDVGRHVANAPPARTEPPRPAPPPPQPSVQPISESMLQSLLSAIRHEPFSDDQLNVLEQAASTQYFLVAQAQQLLRSFAFSNDRIKAMRLLRPRLLDLENGFKLYESFEHSSDKDELKRILATSTP
ncbi:MAG TPA: DUF4476 domain-containing protein [Archangium sp.]|uniref:DUF4476 domain-containing protein n=1 Tax=Archangium sp. TaxID=1872627 RepID=UPI002E2F0733|nr:DUF4476 domain-containing protein [Archangium sp.]HEX5752764.1 DUF4476 domain-containing protein [Archangium sp.]